MGSNVSALFISLKRLSEVLPLRSFSFAGGVTSIANVRDAGDRYIRLMLSIETAAIEWLNHAKIPTLGQLLLSASIGPGDFFTHYGLFYGKGILNAAARYADGKSLAIEPQLRADLSAFVSDASLVLQAHPENFTCASAPGELSGKNRLFVVGRITDGDFPELRAQAYIIGHLHYELRQGDFRDPFDRLPFQMEIYLSNVMPFGEASEEALPSRRELATLKGILERDVKQAFAEIIGEPFVPKDSPSETSDLQTNRLWVNEQQVSAAFIFKGRGKPVPLTIANLSKHGDQISKLFSEPADLIVLQHCEKVTNSIRQHLRAFATRIDDLRPFLIIDGADTVRILRHFKKLGFG
jgi:hypothetical protein